MANRFRAWLRRKLKWRGKTQCPGTACDGSSSQKVAPCTRERSPSPSYATTMQNQPRIRIDGSESLEILRARNPIAPFPLEHARELQPPPDRSSKGLEAEIRAACISAGLGTYWTMDETDPRMAAARTARAIVVAVSTSRSYAAFVGAVTTAERNALLVAELVRDDWPYNRDANLEYMNNSLEAAVNVAMSANAGMTPTSLESWPHSISNACPLESMAEDTPA